MQLPEITSRLGRIMCWRKSACKGVGPDALVEELPLRAELLNVEQLERHARTIAGTHRLATGQADDKLLPRLGENERVLVDTYDLIAAAAARDRRIAPAAEWLLDNFYLIDIIIFMFLPHVKLLSLFVKVKLFGCLRKKFHFFILKKEWIFHNFLSWHILFSLLTATFNFKLRNYLYFFHFLFLHYHEHVGKAL